MVTLSDVKILMLNIPSQLNNRLLKFFSKKLDELNRIGIMFDWIAVDEDEEDYYSDQNITEFPTMIIKRKPTDEQIVGAGAIIDYLLDWLETGKTPSNPIQKKEREPVLSVPSTDLHEYYMSTMGTNDDDEPDDQEKFRNTVLQRMNEMNEARSKSGQHAAKMTNPEMHEKIAQSIMKTKARLRSPVKARSDNIASKFEKTKTDVSALDIAEQMNTGDPDDKLSMQYWQNTEDTEEYAANFGYD